MAYGVDHAEQSVDPAAHLLWRISEDTHELQERAQQMESLTRAIQGRTNFNVGIFGQIETPDVARDVLWANLAQQALAAARTVFEHRSQHPGQAEATLVELAKRVEELVEASDLAGAADPGVL